MNRRTFMVGTAALALVPTKALTALAEQNPWTAGHFGSPFMRLVWALQAESRPGFVLDMDRGVTYKSDQGFVSFGYRNGTTYEMVAEFNVAHFTNTDEAIDACAAMVRRARDGYLSMHDRRPVHVQTVRWEGSGPINEVRWGKDDLPMARGRWV